jgi:hypothetical protein
MAEGTTPRTSSSTPVATVIGHSNNATTTSMMIHVEIRALVWDMKAIKFAFFDFGQTPGVR